MTAWKLVPTEPTEEMWAAITHTMDPHAVWDNMLSASPSVSVPEAIEQMARLIRTHRLKAQGASPIMVLASPDAPAEDADIECAKAAVSLMSGEIADRDAEIAALSQDVATYQKLAMDQLQEIEELRAALQPFATWSGDLTNDEIRINYLIGPHRNAPDVSALIAARAALEQKP